MIDSVIGGLVINDTSASWCGELTGDENEAHIPLFTTLQRGGVTNRSYPQIHQRARANKVV